MNKLQYHKKLYHDIKKDAEKNYGLYNDDITMYVDELESMIDRLENEIGIEIWNMI